MQARDERDLSRIRVYTFFSGIPGWRHEDCLDAMDNIPIGVARKISSLGKIQFNKLLLSIERKESELRLLS